MKSFSIRRTLLFRCGIGVGSLLLVLSTAAYLIVRHSLYEELDRSITQTAALLSNQVELEEGAVVYEWQEGLGSNDVLTLEGLFQFWDIRSGKITRSPALRDNNLPKFEGPDGAPLVKEILLPNGNHARAIGMRTHPFVDPVEMERMRAEGAVIDPHTLPQTLVVACDAEPARRTLGQLRYVLASGSLLTLVLGFTLIDHIIRRALVPLNELNLQISERTTHQLDSSLSLPGGLPSELAGLAANFDSLLARVAGVRRRERDFIRHAAHELRTPIAGLQATAELALSQPREAPEYARFLADCQRSATGLGELVARLSALAHLGRDTPAPAKLEPVALCELLTEILGPFSERFAAREITCISDEIEPELRVVADRTLTRIILNNLLDNAVSYTPAGGEVCIHCQQTCDEGRIVIENTATDLPDDLDCLFDPLFRQNIAEDGSGRHLGIGLTLSLDAARAMAGDLRARARNGRLEMILSLPLFDEN